MSTEDFSLLDWLETGTVATRTVTHYNDQAAYSDYLEWEKRYAEAEAAGDSPERSIAQKDPLQELEEEGERILERLQSSKSVWTVRALSNEELEEVDAEHPIPKAPTEPGRNADPAKLKKYRDFLNGEYAEALDAAVNAQQYAVLVKAFVKMETPRGTVETITAEQLKKFNSVPHGGQLLKRLADAVREANRSEVEIDAPKLRASSDNSQDS